MPREFIQKLTYIVEANLANESFGPADLVREAGMSHSNLNRKLKSISNQNTSQFIREIRLKKAKELLLNEDLTVAEISYLTGFGSPTYFNKCFHTYFGVSPGELRNYDNIIEPEILPVSHDRYIYKHKYVLISLLVGFLVLIPTAYFIRNNINKSKEILKAKSIAVLSFKYLSDEANKQYLADGMMDAILVHLSKIKDLRVVSRTSVEQYKKTNKTSKAIGNELEVEYVLEGSFLMEGEKGRLILQLIRTSDDSHVWSEIFDHDWKDVLSIQIEVAETVAMKLQAVITPEEKQLIRKIPTSNLTAYDYYIQGKSELEKYEFRRKRGVEVLRNAQKHFQNALVLDSTFSLAFTGLAAIYYEEYHWRNFLSKNFMDSVLILANKALSYDSQCAEAYYFRVQVFSETSRTREALTEIYKALKYNPNDWRAFSLRSSIFELYQDNVGALSNLHEVLLRNPGAGQSHFLTMFSYKLASFGFPDLGKKYNKQALDLDGDSLRYINCLAWTEYCEGNFENAYQLSKVVYKKDSTRANNLGLYRVMTGRYEEGTAAEIKNIDDKKKLGEIVLNGSKGSAYYLWTIGRKEEAVFYMNQHIKYHQESIRLGRWSAIQRGSHFDLAEMYAFLGDKKKAYFYLEEVNKNKAFPMWWVILFRHEPFFDNIRQEPRFKKILKDVETKYESERIRVGKWLKEQGML